VFILKTLHIKVKVKKPWGLVLHTQQIIAMQSPDSITSRETGVGKWRPTSLWQDAANLAALYYLSPDPSIEDAVFRQAESLNSEAVVGVFVGVIQAQVLSNSFQPQGSNWKIAANTFLFTGVLLNVIGALIALKSSSTLKAKGGEAKRILENLTDDQLALTVQLRLSPLAARFVSQHYQRFLRSSNNPPEDPRDSLVDDVFGHTRLERVCRSVLSGTKYGALGSAAIVLGIIILPLALICLAVDTQPPAVWITAIAALCIQVLLGVFFIPMQVYLGGRAFVKAINLVDPIS